MATDAEEAQVRHSRVQVIINNFILHHSLQTSLERCVDSEPTATDHAPPCVLPLGWQGSTHHLQQVLKAVVKCRHFYSSGYLMHIVSLQSLAAWYPLSHISQDSRSDWLAWANIEYNCCMPTRLWLSWAFLMQVKGWSAISSHVHTVLMTSFHTGLSSYCSFVHTHTQRERERERAHSSQGPTGCPPHSIITNPPVT